MVKRLTLTEENEKQQTHTHCTTEALCPYLVLVFGGDNLFNLPTSSLSCQQQQPNETLKDTCRVTVSEEKKGKIKSNLSTYCRCQSI